MTDSKTILVSAFLGMFIGLIIGGLVGEVHGWVRGGKEMHAADEAWLREHPPEPGRVSLTCPTNFCYYQPMPEGEDIHGTSTTICVEPEQPSGLMKPIPCPKHGEPKP